MVVVTSLIASVATGLGAILLYRKWRNRLSGPAIALAGWALMTLALALWIVALGPEFGSVVGLTVPSLVVLCIVALHADIRQRGDAPENRQPGKMTAARFSRHLLRFLLAVPVAGIASMCVVTALAVALPWGGANQWAFAIFLLPLVWGAAACWVTLDDRMVQRSVGIVLPGLIGAAFLLARGSL